MSAALASALASTRSLPVKFDLTTTTEHKLSGSVGSAFSECVLSE